MTPEPRTRWGIRAAALYTEAYAERYRAHDESTGAGDAIVRLSRWLHTVCEQFPASIDVLDLGCGTGRYFQALAGLRRLVGIDVSRPMLDRARQALDDISPLAGTVTLIEDDFLTHEFERGEFDLIYSFGVLAEHSPFDRAIAARVERWLKPGGRFAFTTVHPLSSSVPRTLKRRVGEWLLPLASAAPEQLRRNLRDRLMIDGLYADDERVREVLEAVGFAVESLEPFESDVHLHVLAIARKRATYGAPRDDQ